MSSCQKGTGSTQPAPHLQLCCQHLLKAKPGLRAGRDNPDVFCKPLAGGGSRAVPSRPYHKGKAPWMEEVGRGGSPAPSPSPPSPAVLSRRPRWTECAARSAWRRSPAPAARRSSRAGRSVPLSPQKSCASRCSRQPGVRGGERWGVSGASPSPQRFMI